MNSKFIERLEEAGFTGDQAIVLLDIYEKDRANLLDWYKNYPFPTRGDLAGLELRFNEKFSKITHLLCLTRLLFYKAVIICSLVVICLKKFLEWL
jgi:hypothetical protein